MSRRFLLLALFSQVAGKDLSVKSSYDILLNSKDKVHATPHVTNLIRNGASELTESEKSRLSEIGLSDQGNEIVAIKPTDLDQMYDTDHFRFFYTLDGSDAVENEYYVISMGEIFEEVWTFHIDTMGFDPPPTDPSTNHGLYEVYIEYLGSGYFGWANGIGAGPSCFSYIKMQNSYSAAAFSEHTEVENIQVTAVHEFFHAVQFGYNCYERFWFMEATAVWSEDELYNDVNDLYRYMTSWFSNPDKAIDSETNHMYGSFIYFQYIDEHLGGRETIRTCWEKSREYSNSSQDISFTAIDAALEEQNSSFVDAYNRVRIANQIMSSHQNAEPYTYQEANGYLTVVNRPNTKKELYYEKGYVDTESDLTLTLYASHYYSLETNSPVILALIPDSGPLSELSFSTITKLSGTNDWFVQMGTEVNIDPAIGMDRVSIIVSAIGDEGNNWDYTIRLEDGYSEDYTIFSPYPNPTMGVSTNIDLQVISEQTIIIKIIDVLGREIWNYAEHFSEPQIKSLTWNGKNLNGKNAANGVYFIITEGKAKTTAHKITLLKKSD